VGVNAGGEPETIVRPRWDADLDACAQTAREVHAVDGYPPYMPDDDFRGFVASPDALGAWVAVAGDEILGHVALHRSSHVAVTQLATSALGVGPDQLGVVARLLVASSARRQGIGGVLLERATREAQERHLVAILDVAMSLPAAVALYDRSGWTRLGTVVFEPPEGWPIEEFVYAM